jgi:hypothetical protein
VVGDAEVQQRDVVVRVELEALAEKHGGHLVEAEPDDGLPHAAQDGRVVRRVEAVRDGEEHEGQPVPANELS